MPIERRKSYSTFFNQNTFGQINLDRAWEIGNALNEIRDLQDYINQCLVAKNNIKNDITKAEDNLAAINNNIKIYKFLWLATASLSSNKKNKLQPIKFDEELELLDEEKVIYADVYAGNHTGSNLAAVKEVKLKCLKALGNIPFLTLADCQKEIDSLTNLRIEQKSAINYLYSQLDLADTRISNSQQELVETRKHLVELYKQLDNLTIQDDNKSVPNITKYF